MLKATAATVALLLASPAPPAVAPKCSIDYQADARMTELIRQGGLAFEGYERLCSILASKKLGLDIISSDGVLEGRGYGWVSVSFIRLKTGVVGREGRVATALSQDADSPASGRAMLRALFLVMSRFAADADRYVLAVDKEEARLRQALAQQ